ncbi:Proton-coupled folate transporter [Nymphon striatum]|nr:Proton-coupled folate transporter [Nymphon striatum]
MEEKASDISGIPASESISTRKPFPLVTAEITLFLFSLISFCVTPAAKNLLLTKACYEKFNDMDYCSNTSNSDIGQDDYVQDRVAKYNMYSNVGNLVPSGIAVIFAGSWGDNFGRKLPLLIPPFGMAISSIVYMLFAIYLKDAPIWMHVVANIASGITGGELVAISASFCYVISISNAKYRIIRLSILEGMIIVPAMIGPLISEALKVRFGNYPTFILCIVLSAVTLLYNVLFLIEIKPDDAKEKTLKNLLNIRHFIDSGKVLIRPRPNNRRKYILLTLLALCLHFFAANGRPNKRGSQRRFQSSWLQRYSSLEYIIQADEGFCLPCMLFGVGS